MVVLTAAQLKSWVPGLQLIYPNIQRLTANNVVFTWSADLEKEFQVMKKAIQEAVKLSPIDINKKLYTFVDAAVTVGRLLYLQSSGDNHLQLCKEHEYLHEEVNNPRLFKMLERTMMYNFKVEGNRWL